MQEKLTHNTPTTRKPAAKREAPQPTQRKLPRPNPPPLRQGVPRNIVSQVCGLVDPFCEHAAGAKYPDDSSKRTLAYSMRQQFNIVTDANGNGSIVIVPQMGNGTVCFGGVAVGTSNVTSAVNVAAAPTVGLAGASQYRIVSCGFKLKNISPVLSSSGVVCVRSWVNEDGASYAAYDAASYNASQIKNIPLIDCKDEAYIFEHTSQMPQNFYFYTIGTPTLASWAARGFQPMTVAILGGPANAQALFVELVYNVEFTFADSEPLGMVATPSPSSNSLVTSTAALITSKAETWAHASLEKVSNYVTNSALRYLQNALLKAPSPYAKAAGVAMIPMVD